MNMRKNTRKKRVIIGAAACLLAITALAFIGCSSGTSGSTSNTQPAASTHTVTDMAGATVELPNDINSIVCSRPVVSQPIMLLGGGDKITGGSVAKSDMNTVIFPWTKDFKNVSYDKLNAETTLSYNPDMVIWGSGSQTDTPDWLTQSSIPVIHVWSGTSSELVQTVKVIGDALGGDAPQKATQFADYYQKQKDQAQSLTGQLTDSQRPIVYFTYSDDGMSTYGTDSIADEWIGYAGGKFTSETLNINGFTTKMTAESIISANPDIIICTSVAAKNLFTTDATYSGIKAVQNGKVYVNPTGASAWYKAFVEAPLQIPWALSIIQPDIAKANSIDPASEVKSFYSTFYGHTLTNSELDSIMNPAVGTSE